MVISLYFHFPFCKQKCPYCHFYVIPLRHNTKGFLKALLKEWELRLPLIAGKKIASIYFGGGTPSLFPQGIEAILKHITAPEITVEANPEDLTLDLLKYLYALGVNRLSIGVQTLDNILLKHLGRNHTADQAITAVYRAHEAKFKNITIDLMYELPYQTFEAWQDTVKKVTALPISHLSLYNLTFEPHTVFKKKEQELHPHLPSDETATAMLRFACEQFETAHLKRYEISAFARNELHSIHNSGYWTGREFLGFGPSAFSYLEGKRFQNVCHLNRYIKYLETETIPVAFEEKLSPLASLHEQIAIGLRLIEGISLQEIPLSTKALLQSLHKEGWLFYDNNHVSLTDQGRLFYDTVAEKIIL